MEKIFESNYLTINYNTSLGCIIMDWKPVIMKSEEYREGLEQGLKIVNERNIQFWIANLQDMKIIKLADEKWKNEIWFPRALKATIKKMGIVVSKDVFNKVAVTNIMNQKEVKLSIESKYFSTVTDVAAWIKTFALANV